jgi:hypothetical protein
MQWCIGMQRVVFCYISYALHFIVVDFMLHCELLN